MLLAKWVGQYIHQMLGKFEMEPPVRLLFIRVVRGMIILLTLLVVLQQFGIQIFPLIAGLGIAGVGIGLALQGVFMNLFAGLSIIFTKPFRVGEYIELLGVYGEVQAIDLFFTKLQHMDQSRVVVPNRMIIGEILHNYGKIRQLDLTAGVAYASDLTEALSTVRTIVKANSRVLQDPEPVIGISMLDNSSINISCIPALLQLSLDLEGSLSFIFAKHFIVGSLELSRHAGNISVKPWVNVPDYVPAQAELYQEIVEQFRAHDVQIPFPQREIRMLNAV